MRSERATRDTWKTNPMPEASARLHVEKTYSAEEYAGIAMGLIPQEMEDRWFMFLEDDWLYLHRSWTGNMIYKVRFASIADGYQIAETWVNRDPAQYKRTDDDFDVIELLALIGWLTSDNQMRRGYN